MSGKRVVLVLVLALTTTLLNVAFFVGQMSTPATARAGANASKLLDDDDSRTALQRSSERPFAITVPSARETA
jgi:hypothetical protein